MHSGFGSAQAKSFGSAQTKSSGSDSTIKICMESWQTPFQGDAEGSVLEMRALFLKNIFLLFHM
jgi:hypothetical protein